MVLPNSNSLEVLLPHWNQLADPDPVGALDPWRSEDCGEECASIIIEGCTGVYTWEQELRLALPHGEGWAQTAGSDLVELLYEYKVNAHAEYMNAQAMRDRVIEGLRRGRPAIVIGYFLSPSELHWVIPVSWAPPTVRYLDPWGGLVKGVRGLWFRRMYAGEVVLCDTPVRGFSAAAAGRAIGHDV